MPKRQSRGSSSGDEGAGLLALARRVDGARAESALALLQPHASGSVLALGVLISAAFPGMALTSPADLELPRQLLREGWSAPRDRSQLAKRIASGLKGDDDEGAALFLRRFARFERARVALRELFPRGLGGADVDTTSRELSTLADATVEAALQHARAWGVRRYGEPVSAAGRPSSFVVLGMGKLGGGELNPGSDIDLLYFYDTDEGEVRKEGAPVSMTLHEFWTRVARRLTSTLEEITPEGFVWRVDLRLRPEGAGGPLVNSALAAERYYESFGRPWERAALLRARPIAGDFALGDSILESLAPFVWRRRIDPSIANEMHTLVHRARLEIAGDDDRDLKLGRGGIREAEFFAQTLQLVFGGKEPTLRARGTLEALARLEAKGFITPRDAAEMSDAYLALRRVEHVVQSASGLQTHSLPRGADLERTAVSLGFPSVAAFEADLEHHRRNVEARFRSLLPEGAIALAADLAGALASIEAGEETRLAWALMALSRGELDEEAVSRLASGLIALAKRPDDILGARTRDSFPGLAETVVDAILEAADPVQAARYLRLFFERLRQPAVYVRLVASDPAALRRMVALVGASAFVGDALANNPELGDIVLFSREPVTTESAAREVASAPKVVPAQDEDPDETLIGALRLAKTRATLEVAVALLAGELSVRQVSAALTAVADTSLEVAARRALGDDDASVRGFAVIAMGKLGSQEISFGSDLDVLFLYDPDTAPAGSDALAYFTKRARRVITLITAFHGAGPGYELDTRLRPSGNQGLLVTSLDAFARYHGFESAEPDAPATNREAAIWERMALTRARAVAGDRALGERAVAIAERASARGAPSEGAAAEEVRRIRSRVEREASLERLGVRDLKLGRGGLLDIEFVVQLLTVRAAAEKGAEHAPLGRDTEQAIAALEKLELLSPDRAETLASGYRFLRRLEAMIRVVRADASHILEERSPTLRALARRMDFRERAGRHREDALLAKYLEMTDAIRSILEEVLGSGSGLSPGRT